MNVRKERFVWVLLLLLVLMIGLVSLNGCKKSEPAASEDHTGHEHAMTEVADTETADQKGEALIAKLRAEVEEVIEQTTCPVMGDKIDKDIFVKYKGRKVYLCCAMCEGKFKADPEKYISKLPQFQK
jgi:YHS domain-containing protein